MDSIYVGKYFDFGYSFYWYDFAFGFMLSPQELHIELIVVDLTLKFRADVPMGWI